MFSEAEKNYLQRLVSQALAAAVAGEEFLPPLPPAPRWMVVGGGCFVTYKTAGNLRGCLGCFQAPTPLYVTVAEYANYSATGDPRFGGQRLKTAELAQVDWEVSLLSPLLACTAPEEISLGVHGIQVSDGRGRSGCFLPQVATETGWSVAEFWGHCCADKAGLPGDFWRRTGAKLFTFTAEIMAGHYAD
jgi:AmmeMemoRadiSam system protein A